MSNNNLIMKDEMKDVRTLPGQWQAHLYDLTEITACNLKIVYKRMPGSTYFHTEFLRTIIGAKRFHF